MTDHKAVDSSELRDQASKLGFALVPFKLTKEMDSLLREEEWTWADLLAAAEAITEDEYELSSRAATDSPSLISAAQAVIDRWHSPAWKDAPHTAEYIARLQAAIASRTDMKAEPVATFQQRVQPWMMECFGAEISADGIERNHRFFEEATELVQSLGMTQSEAHQLVDYVYGRDVGEPVQEVGGVMVTLAALCLASGMDMHQAGETELARIWTMVEKIRAKQAAKPKHSPLPASIVGESERIRIDSDENDE